MQIPLQITIRDMPASAVLEDHIREKAAKLEHFYPALVGCRVVVELPHKHKQHGKLFNVRIDLTVPGSEIVINRDQSEDVYVALRDAFDAANRKLEDYGRRQRGDVKTHEGRVEEAESPDPDAEDGTQSNVIPPG
ncbi:MAG: HPF/RaiA family ribosome-associated protein [Pseudomonadota bacterium]